jgi:hypothetical protein
MAYPWTESGCYKTKMSLGAVFFFLAIFCSKAIQIFFGRIFGNILDEIIG